MRNIFYLLIVLSCVPGVSAITNTSYDYYDQEYAHLAGENVVTPFYHFNDEYFSLYNDGNMRYNIYMYNYVGCVTMNEKSYSDSFIGCIEPNQMIMLNNNASYYIYADYDDISDLSDPDYVIDKIQSRWYLIIFVLLLIITALAVWKVIK